MVLLDIHVENAGSDEFSPVRDALMSVRGFCFKIVHCINAEVESNMLYITDWYNDMDFKAHVDVLEEFEEGGLYDHPDGVEFTLL